MQGLSYGMCLVTRPANDFLVMKVRLFHSIRVRFKRAHVAIEASGILPVSFKIDASASSTRPYVFLLNEQVRFPASIPVQSQNVLPVGSKFQLARRVTELGRGQIFLYFPKNCVGTEAFVSRCSETE
jgi:hypothetical protein